VHASLRRIVAVDAALLPGAKERPSTSARWIQVNRRTCVPQRLKCLIYNMYQSGIGFKCPYSNRPLKPLLNVTFV
jgi:hypothetical protein